MSDSTTFIKIAMPHVVFYPCRDLCTAILFILQWTLDTGSMIWPSLVVALHQSIYHVYIYRKMTIVAGAACKEQCQSKQWHPLCLPSEANIRRGSDNGWVHQSPVIPYPSDLPGTSFDQWILTQGVARDGISCRVSKLAQAPIDSKCEGFLFKDSQAL